MLEELFLIVSTSTSSYPTSPLCDTDSFYHFFLGRGVLILYSYRPSSTKYGSIWS